MDGLLERAYDPCSMRESDDGELMARAQDGERPAFDELVRRHERAVYAYARHCLGDETRAVEATQDAFVRAYTYRSSFDSTAGSVRGWLLAVAANTVRDAIRVRRAAPLPLEHAAAVPSSSDDGLAAFQRTEVRESVARELSRLDPQHREVLALRYVSGLSFDEVASVLGITVGAAKMRAARARDVLARRLADLAPREDGRSA